MPAPERSGTPEAGDGLCVFCEIIAERAPARVVRRWHDCIAFEPLNPVTRGHILVVPHEHVPHALIKPLVTARAMHRATEVAHHPCNILTSVGHEATQTIQHLHIHVVPRRTGDGLLLPWSKHLADVLGEGERTK